MSKTILCYGDSNTFGTMPTASLMAQGRFGHEARWTSVMAGALGAGVEVIAQGLPGRTTVHDDPIEGAHRNGLTLLKPILESHRPVDLVILMLGTNDLKYRFSVSAWDIAASIGRLAMEIRASQCGPDGHAPQVLVVCPPPILEVGAIGPAFEGGAVKSQALAATCRDMAKRLDLPLIDAGAIIAVSPLDGIHYTGQTQISLGLALAKEVKEHFL